jgi:hypothetical protein
VIEHAFRDEQHMPWPSAGLANTCAIFARSK